MPQLIILLLLLLIQGNTSESSSSVKIEPTDKWTVIGKETIMVQGKPIELTVWVKKENYDGKTFFSYRKENEDGTFEVDSTVNLDGTYSIWETNYITGVTRNRRITGVESYVFDDESGNTIKKYYIGLPKDEIYNENGWLMPNLKEVRGDTAFVDLEYYDAVTIPVD